MDPFTPDSPLSRLTKYGSAKAPARKPILETSMTRIACALWGHHVDNHVFLRPAGAADTRADRAASRIEDHPTLFRERSMLRNPAKNISISIALFISLSLAPFGVAVCQRMASLRTGESIRLSVISRPDFRVKGKLLAVSPDTITLRGPNGALSVGLSDVSLLEVKRRNALSVTRSVVVGLFAGAVGGALIGSTRGPTNTGDGIITTPVKELLGGIAGGLAGVIGGTVYGVCCSGGWERVPTARNP